MSSGSQPTNDQAEGVERVVVGVALQGPLVPVVALDAAQRAEREPHVVDLVPERCPPEPKGRAAAAHVRLHLCAGCEQVGGSIS